MRERSLDSFQCLWQHSSTTLRVHVDASGREQRLRECGHGPFVPVVVLFFSPTQNFPVAARDHEPALASPVPLASTVATAGHLIDAAYRRDLVAVQWLRGDQVVQSVGVLLGDLWPRWLEWRILDADVLLALPHWQRAMRHVPCLGQPCDGGILVGGWWFRWRERGRAQCDGGHDDFDGVEC